MGTYSFLPQHLAHQGKRAKILGIIAVSLILALAFVLAGCSQGQNEGTASSAGKVEELDSSVTIEPTVILDSNGVKVTANSLKITGGSAALAITIENGAQEEVEVITGSVGYSRNCINDCMIPDGHINTKVTAGNKSEQTISFDALSLAQFGITKIANISIGFQLNVGKNTTYPDPVTIQTSAAEGFKPNDNAFKEAMGSKAYQAAYGYKAEFMDTGNTIAGGNVQIVSEALLTNKDNQTMYVVECKNDNDQPVIVTASDIDVNGITVCAGNWTSQIINPHCIGVLDMSFDLLLKDNIKSLLKVDQIGSIKYDLKLKSFSEQGYASAAEIAPAQTLSVKIKGGKDGFDQSGTVVYEGNGITVRSLGITEDEMSSSKDLHAMFLVQNATGGDIVAEIDDDYVSSDGQMIKSMCFSTTIGDGSAGVVDCELQGSALEAAGKTKPSDIKSLDCKLVIKDSHFKKLVEENITVKY